MSLKVNIVAADSMGVRSIATFVEACGVSIGIDLGASIAPYRFSLPPHPLELKRLEEALDRARRYVNESQAIIITHYHYDHYLRDEPERYYKKLVYAKDIRYDINRSQSLRGYRFIVKGGVGDRASLEYADRRTFEFEGVKLRFSHPVWHGEEGTKLGKVLMVVVECDEGKVVFASDVQGPPTRDAIEWLSTEARGADILIVSGPASYLAGYRVSSESVSRGIEGLLEVLVRARPRVAIVDHHFVRDPKYNEYRKLVEERLRASGIPTRVLSAAEYMGKPFEPLEAMRKQLWKETKG